MILANNERLDVWRDAYLRASNTGRIIAMTVSRNLDVLDLTLRSLDDGLSFPGLAGLSLPNRNHVLYNRSASAGLFANLFVMNASGDLTVDSGSLIPRAVNYADRPYFSYLRDHPGPEMYVSPPALSKVGDGWTMPVARRLSAPDGAFVGVAVGGLRLNHIFRLFQEVNLHQDDILSLTRPDGMIVVRWPAKEGTIGVAAPEKSPTRKFAPEAANSSIGPSRFDAVERFWVAMQVGPYPLAVTVAFSTSDLFSAWISRISWIALTLSVLSVLIAALTFWLTGEVSRRARSEIALARQNSELETRRSQFDAALSNMTQGLIFFDHTRKLLVCNRRYGELYGLSGEQTRAGTSVLQILRDRVERGTFPDMTPAQYLLRMETLSQVSGSFSVMDKLRDGRTIACYYEKLPRDCWVATYEDVTERCRAEENLLFMARHDALTGLPNRVLFQERLENAVDLAKSGIGGAVICIDLDHFKEVNDSLGHPVGDRLLQAAADRLQACVRKVDTVARLGGDEFAIVQLGVEDTGDVTLLTNRIIAAFRNSFDIGAHQIEIGASMGVAVITSDGLNSGQLLKNADFALYLAKSDGRGAMRLFEPEMEAHMNLRRALELELRTAILHRELEVHYQPLVNIRSGKVSGFEALLRWRHPVRGFVGPEVFIPIAEESGQIVGIGDWVLRTACTEAAGWPAHIKVAVNLSPVQFKKPGLVAAVQAALNLAGLQPDRLEVEITESVILLETEGNLAALRQLRDLGIAVALDDFGTGYSSLSYLRSFPFDKIKIDQSFVRDLQNREASLIIRAVAGLGQSLGIRTTAEGVESQEQLDALRDEGCTEAQGYFFSQPQPAHALRALIEQIEGRCRDLGSSGCPPMQPAIVSCSTGANETPKANLRFVNSWADVGADAGTLITARS